MSEAAPAAPAAPPKKGRKLLMIVVCLVFTGAGAAFPFVVNVTGKPKDAKDGSADKKDPKDAKAKSAIVPLGDITVNLSEERFQRYLRLKMAVQAELEAEKEVTDLLTKKKAAIKSAMIAHLASKTVKDVTGSAGVNRMQRELLERLEEVVYPDGGSKLKAVLFEEYVVQ